MTFRESGDPGLEERIKELFDLVEYKSEKIEEFENRKSSIIESMKADRAKGISTEDANCQLAELEGLITAEIGEGKGDDVERNLAQVRWLVSLAKIYFYGNKPQTCLRALEDTLENAEAYYNQSRNDFSPIIKAVEELISLIEE